MLKFYKLDDTDFADFVDDIAEMRQPYIYQIEEGSDTYVIASDVEIDEDDIENIFNDKIEEYEDDYDGY